MRRIVLSLLLLACLSGGLVAQASSMVPEFSAPPAPTQAPPFYEDVLEVSQDADAFQMVAPEEIQVKFTLSGGARAPIERVRICRGNGSVILEPGALNAQMPSYLFTESITPTDTQLGEGAITYLVRYTLGAGLSGEREEERVVRIPLSKLPAKPGVEFTRSIPITSAMSGEEVAIVYRVRNTGNVALTDISVSDELAGEVGVLDKLAPGHKQTFVHRFELDNTCTSKPKITYSHRATREVFEKDLDPASICLADEQLEISLEADQSTVAPGGMVTLTYSIVNNGTATYDHLRLSDQLLGELSNPPSELRAGQQYVFTKTVAMKATSTFQFTMCGRSAGGSELEVVSNPLTVAVTPVIESIQLELLVEPSARKLQDPGVITFSITVRNNGSLDLHSVRLSERERGLIKTLAVVAPGDTVITEQYPVDKSSSFVFLAELTDAKGGRLVVVSDPAISIEFAQDGAAAETPAPSAYSQPESTAYRLTGVPTTFSRMMIGIVAVLAVLTMCVAASSASRRRKKRKQRARHMRKLRRNFQRERMEDERQQTKPHPIVRREKKPVPTRQDPVSRKPGSVPKRDKGGRQRNV